MIANDIIISMKKWLSIGEASKYLGIGKTKLYGLAQEGKLPAAKLDKQWKFNTADLDKWLKSNKSIENFFTSISYSIEDNDMLREPQKEAYKAIYDYFKNGGKMALVQLPVGCGKSGVAAITPLGIARGRVLVITPNLTIRDEMKNNLDITHRKCFWKRTGVLKPEEMQNGPYVTTLNSGNITICDTSHIIVTNVQQLSTNEDKWLKKFPSDYFDMIINDEAHHVMADGWNKVIKQFPNAKILHMTATPFRSDKKEIPGDKVYRYPFRSATTNGYIKKLTAVYISPKEITLSFKDESERHTFNLKQILEMREDDWFSRGIAMSDECNKSIVDNSIEKLEQLRFESSVKHQIIASAMSINHAKKIKLLYQARNYETEVVHSKMKSNELENVHRRLKNNELDVIVNVSMLGEGFDHPQLSVAAIFTPYRTLKPYLQFVGRIMRVIHQNAPLDPDNYGFIVTHAGMNINRLLDQFKLFEKDDEEFWAKVTGGIEPEEPLRRGETFPLRKKLKSDMVVHGEIVEDLFEEPFVDIADESKKITRDFLEAQGYDEDKINSFLQTAYSQAKDKKTKASLPLVILPQQELEMLKKRLTIDVNSKAKIVLNNSKLPIVGLDIPRKLFPDVSGGNNLVSVIIMINQEIKRAIGPKERSEWSIDEYRKSLDILPNICTSIVRRIIKVKKVKNAKR